MFEDLFTDFYITKFFSFNLLYSEAGAGNIRKDRKSWAIVFKFEGETEYKIGKNAIISNVNNVAILPRGVDYSWQCKQNGHYFSLEFDSNKTYDTILSFPITDSDELMEFFSKIQEELKPNNQFKILKILNLIYSIIYLLLNNQMKKNDNNLLLNTIMPAIEYIYAHYTENISNDALAKMCYVSTSYFRKLFFNCYGMPPIQFITKLRIDKAKELLCGDYTSIGDVATLVGYDNIYHFSKVFKIKTGYSPLNYIKHKYPKLRTYNKTSQ